ncbi:hypothetical protein BH23GEM10_BH23GEM10_02100 [soil metagenome]
MKLLLTAVSLPFVMLAATAAATPHVAADELKCGKTERTVPHYIVDGVFLGGPDAPEGSVVPDVEAGDIARLDVLCWDPVRRVLQKGSGEPVVLITTKQFMTALNEDMERVVAAQDAFRAKHGRFAGLITDLDVDLVTPGLEVSITAARDGWYAGASGNLLRVRCNVFAGNIDRPNRILKARVPVCNTV